jgi:hypothetical protein
MVIKTRKWLVVIPLMVRVFAYIHIVIFSIGKLATVFPAPPVSYIKVAPRTKQDAVTEEIRATIAFWLPKYSMAMISAHQVSHQLKSKHLDGTADRNL